MCLTLLMLDMVQLLNWIVSKSQVFYTNISSEIVTYKSG